MYIEIVPNRTSPPAILLRESFRDGGQIRKRTLANLSHWEPARVEALRRTLRGDFDHLTGGDPICGPVFGVLYALKHVADDLGLTGVLGRMAVYLHPADKYSRLIRRVSLEQTGLDERALLASQRPSP